MASITRKAGFTEAVGLVLVITSLLAAPWKADSSPSLSAPTPEPTCRARLVQGSLWQIPGQASAIAEESDPRRNTPEFDTPSDPSQILDGITINLEDASLDESLGKLVLEQENGMRIILTLDPHLQTHLTATVRRYAEPAESLVALDPVTGRVLAWVEATSDPAPWDHPASSSGAYAASIFKIVTGTALIEEAGVDPDESVCVPRVERSVRLSDLTPDPRRDRVCVDMVSAMAGSVNAYFARQTDAHLSAEQMSAWLERFGFNQPIPFELEVQPSSAAVPEDRLERARMAAGFRHAYLSPLHGALMVAAIANGGQMMRPTLVEAIEDRSGRTLYQHQPTVWRRVMHSGTSRIMTRVLSRTTIDGTARRYFAQRRGWPDDLEVAGKTGTLSNRSADQPEPDPLLTYSWFVGFAPIEDPNIAVSSLVCNGALWHIRGSYLASEAIYQYHLNGP
ncbi:MAG: hypothetical protein JW797_16365 [Bradymonadales bacterium]|nr:hypothetical protein [Bradymonadales bacterium]